MTNDACAAIDVIHSLLQMSRQKCISQWKIERGWNGVRRSSSLQYFFLSSRFPHFPNVMNYRGRDSRWNGLHKGCRVDEHRWRRCGEGARGVEMIRISHC